MLHALPEFFSFDIIYLVFDKENKLLGCSDLKTILITTTGPSYVSALV
jgi:hypothetical protein